MTPRTYWNKYVKRQGGAAPTAAALGIPYSTIAGICNGSRGIGRVLAKRMSAADKSLDESVLIWVQAMPVKLNVLPREGEAPKKKGASRAA
ncbi:hypothetical protein [Stenotrophomonas maltophilia]|uniref:hypothetical protein n=1 Tax=Stenotrophomonas maltophilia TaxID=40324 RepID=UPI00066B0463|nr:hypothetical protein [Stenotrophomonas maltophilia]MBH1417139.1 hypothetical protein [Stenotrophomonas maltophilia]HDS1569310.1 hypothetical protein [Stenotrophomonas maltophilia]HDS1591425.1 hypothetical protein [Stenotrophomonas maltophilia]